MRKPPKSITERIAEHPMYSRCDLKYLRNKGYTDPEILAFWDRDHKMGCKPVQHRPGGIGPTRAIVPENDESDLFAAIREQLSPQAVATIVAFLQPAQTKNPDVNRQVDWFRGQLVELVGGNKAFSDLCNEVGL